MSKKLGRLLLLRKPDPDNEGQFFNACGFRSKNFTISPNVIEETSDNCQSPSESPAVEREYGSVDRSFSGSGRYSDDLHGRDIALAAENTTVLSGWQIVVPGHGIYTGDWTVGNFTFTGDENGSMTFTCDIAQASKPVFAVEV